MPLEFEDLSKEVSQGSEVMNKGLEGVVGTAEKLDKAFAKLSATQQTSLQISEKIDKALKKHRERTIALEKVNLKVLKQSVIFNRESKKTIKAYKDMSAGVAGISSGFKEAASDIGSFVSEIDSSTKVLAGLIDDIDDLNRKMKATSGKEIPIMVEIGGSEGLGKLEDRLKRLSSFKVSGSVEIDTTSLDALEARLLSIHDVSSKIRVEVQGDEKLDALRKSLEEVGSVPTVATIIVPPTPVPPPVPVPLPAPVPPPVPIPLPVPDSLEQLGDAARKASEEQELLIEKLKEVKNAGEKLQILKDIGKQAATEASLEQLQAIIRGLKDEEAAKFSNIEATEGLAKAVDEVVLSNERYVTRIERAKKAAIEMATSERNLRSEIDRTSKSLTDVIRNAFAEGEREAEGFAGGLGKTATGMMAVGVAAFFLFKKMGELASSFKDSAVELSKFNVKTVALERTLYGVSRGGLEEMRRGLFLTRQQAEDFFMVVTRASNELGMSESKIAAVSKALQQTFGGDQTERLKDYVDLLKTIPTIETDLKINAEMDDQAAALFGLAQSGNMGAVIDLQSAGLMGGAEVGGSKDTDLLNSAQRMEGTVQGIKDFLTGSLFPTWGPQFSAIAEGTMKVLAAVAGGTLVLGALSKILGAKLDINTLATTTGFGEVVAAITAQTAVLGTSGSAKSGGKIASRAAKKKFLRTPKTPVPTKTGTGSGSIVSSSVKGIKSLTQKIGSLAKGIGYTAFALIGISIVAGVVKKKFLDSGKEFEAGIAETTEGLAIFAGSVLMGAKAGALLGSLLGPLGTVIGGILGAFGGLIMSGEMLGHGMEVMGKKFTDEIELFDGTRIKKYNGVINSIGVAFQKFGPILSLAMADMKSGIKTGFLKVIKSVVPGALVNGFKVVFGKSKEYEKLLQSAGYQLQKYEKQHTKMREAEAKYSKVIQSRQEKLAKSYLALGVAIERNKQIFESLKFRLNDFNRQLAMTNISVISSMGGTIAGFSNAIVSATDEVSKKFEMLSKDLDERRKDILSQGDMEYTARENALNDVHRLELEAAQEYANSMKSVADEIFNNPKLQQSGLQSAIRVTNLQMEAESGRGTGDDINKSMEQFFDETMQRVDGLVASEKEASQQIAKIQEENAAKKLEAERKLREDISSYTAQVEVTGDAMKELEKRVAKLSSVPKTDIGELEKNAKDAAEAYVEAFKKGVATRSDRKTLDAAMKKFEEAQKALDAASDTQRDLANAQKNLSEVTAKKSELEETAKLKGKAQSLITDGEIDLKGAEAFYVELKEQQKNLSDEIDKYVKTLPGTLESSTSGLKTATTRVKDAEETQSKASKAVVKAQGGTPEEVDAAKKGKEIADKELKEAQDQEYEANRVLKDLVESILGKSEQADDVLKYLKTEASLGKEMTAEGLVDALKGKQVDFGDAWQKFADSFEEGIKTQAIVDSLKGQAAAVSEISTIMGLVTGQIDAVTLSLELESKSVEERKKIYDEYDSILKVQASLLDGSTRMLKKQASEFQTQAVLEGLTGDAIKATADATKKNTEAIASEVETWKSRLNTLKKEATRLRDQEKIALDEGDTGKASILGNLAGRTELSITDIANNLENSISSLDKFGDAFDRMNSMLQDTQPMRQVGAYEELADALADAAQYSTDLGRSANDSFQIAVKAAKGRAALERESAKAALDAEKTALEARFGKGKVTDEALSAADAKYRARLAGIETREKESVVNAAERSSKLKQDELDITRDMLDTQMDIAETFSGSAEAIGPILEQQLQVEQQRLGFIQEELENTKLAFKAGEVGIKAVREKELAVIQQQAKIRKQELDNVKKVLEARRRELDIVSDVIQDQMSFISDMGGSFSSMIELQQQSVAIEKQKLDIAKEELDAAVQRGVEGAELLELEANVRKQELNLQRKALGVQKDMMEKLIGAAFGEIRSSVGAIKNRGSDVGLLGVNRTRVVSPSGAFLKGKPMTIEERSIKAQTAAGGPHGAFTGKMGLGLGAVGPKKLPIEAKIAEGLKGLEEPSKTTAESTKSLSDRAAAPHSVYTHDVNAESILSQQLHYLKLIADAILSGNTDMLKESVGSAKTLENGLKEVSESTNKTATTAKENVEQAGVVAKDTINNQKEDLNVARSQLKSSIDILNATKVGSEGYAEALADFKSSLDKVSSMEKQIRVAENLNPIAGTGPAAIGEDFERIMSGKMMPEAEKMLKKLGSENNKAFGKIAKTVSLKETSYRNWDVAKKHMDSTDPRSEERIRATAQMIRSSQTAMAIDGVISRQQAGLPTVGKDATADEKKKAELQIARINYDTARKNVEMTKDMGGENLERSETELQLATDALLRGLQGGKAQSFEDEKGKITSQKEVPENLKELDEMYSKFVDTMSSSMDMKDIPKAFSDLIGRPYESPVSSETTSKEKAGAVTDSIKDVGARPEEDTTKIYDVAKQIAEDSRGSSVAQKEETLVLTKASETVKSPVVEAGGVTAKKSGDSAVAESIGKEAGTAIAKDVSKTYSDIEMKAVADKQREITAPMATSATYGSPAGITQDTASASNAMKVTGDLYVHFDSPYFKDTMATLVAQLVQTPEVMRATKRSGFINVNET